MSRTDTDAGFGIYKNITSSFSQNIVTSNLETQQQTLFLSLDRQLDFETARVHNINLTCYDTEELTARATLIVTVEPVKDN